MHNTEEQEFQELASAEQEMAGWCPSCEEWVNHGQVEPDAIGYTCEVCGEQGVCGSLTRALELVS